MKIKYISPIGKENKGLFPTFTETLISQGHTIVDDIEQSDTAFIDMFSGLGNYYTRELDTVLYKRLNAIFFDESDYGGCRDGTEEWFGFNEPKNYNEIPQWQDVYWRVKSYCKVVYFMRKMDKTKQFPSYLHPYELTMYDNCIFEPVSKDELFNREYDICFIGNSSQTRNNVCNELVKHFKCAFHLGLARTEHNDWLDRHRNSKLYLECCGGGMGSERPYQLTYIAPMLRTKNNQLILHNFRDGLECIEVSEHPTTSEISNIKTVLNDKELLYEMYLAGISRMRKYFNPKYRSQYILDTLKKEGIC